MKKRKYTIRDIAARAHVSVSTVSRVINNAEDVNHNTRALVKELIREMNYKPNPAATALVGKSSRYVAVIVPNIHHSTISKTVQGIMKELQAEDFDVLLFDYDESVEKERHYYELLNRKMIDGLILITSIADETDIREISRKIPTVLIDRVIPGADIDSIVTDEDLGMELLVRHLVSLGHEKIGFINGEKGTSSADQRMESFRKAMTAEGLPLDDRHILHTSWSLTGGRDAFTRLMKNGCEATALIFASDQMALGALGAAYKLGLKVPGDISMVGFDNFKESEVSVPPLTTLDFPAHDVGTEAARCLLKKIGGQGERQARKIVLPVSLLERDSAAPVSAAH